MLTLIEQKTYPVVVDEVNFGDWTSQT